jgi:sialic acid synthase SpsE
VALGASLYERHLKLDGDDACVDSAVSSTPAELADAVAGARRAWAALGSGQKACVAAEAVNRTPSRRSLRAARDLPAGSMLTPADLIALRPGDGLPPSDLPLICGLRLRQALRRGDPIRRAHLERRPRLEASHRVA